MQPHDPALQKCRAILQTLYGTRLKGVVLYGSCARGTEETESDIERKVWPSLHPASLPSYIGSPFCSKRSYNSRTDSPNSAATARHVSSPR